MPENELKITGLNFAACLRVPNPPRQSQITVPRTFIQRTHPSIPDAATEKSRNNPVGRNSRVRRIHRGIQRFVTGRFASQKSSSPVLARSLRGILRAFHKHRSCFWSANELEQTRFATQLPGAYLRHGTIHEHARTPVFFSPFCNFLAGRSTTKKRKRKKERRKIETNGRYKGKG